MLTLSRSPDPSLTGKWRMFSGSLPPSHRVGAHYYSNPHSSRAHPKQAGDRTGNNQDRRTPGNRDEHTAVREPIEGERGGHTNRRQRTCFSRKSCLTLAVSRGWHTSLDTIPEVALPRHVSRSLGPGAERTKAPSTAHRTCSRKPVDRSI